MRRRFLSEVVGGAAAVTALFGVGTHLLADSESTTSSSPTGLKAVAVAVAFADSDFDAVARGTWTGKKNDGESVGIPHPSSPIPRRPSSGIQVTDSSVTWTFQR
ncbi:hypothetical protein [Streptomyces griseiscabiei]|uniref:Secreted protein n=1 Tax=Streptomyces griseiscabiei TaxID=2993540 RepID=A0ABU4L6E1_9ACTN|nr:hypothetical protein [Streptomyces griseiscabiei]MDX2911307.1 hypothetical protein [Streptomyces griseiscabiei]